MGKNQLRNLTDVLVEGESAPEKEWQLRVIADGECLTYVAWNSRTEEGLVIDPKFESLECISNLLKEIQESSQTISWIGVIDTHTHADHISGAPLLAEQMKVPLMMSQLSPCTRVHLRVVKETSLTLKAGVVRLIPTPGHTADGLCVIWGPFIFTGDTVLYGDVGRDDLPTGSPEAHYESLQLLNEKTERRTLVCPGHDPKGGRVSSWETQLKINSSLTQAKQDFVRESAAFDVPAPLHFKKSLVENFK